MGSKKFLFGFNGIPDRLLNQFFHLYPLGFKPVFFSFATWESG